MNAFIMHKELSIRTLTLPQTMRFVAFRLMSSVLLIALGLPSAAWAQTTEGEVLLQAKGVLEAGDATLQDGSLYDGYIFEGRAGQAVAIALRSDAFDTHLLLLDGNNQTLAENDNWNEDENSMIGYVLPANGTYKLLVNSSNESGQGTYEMTLSTTEPDSPIVLQSKADSLNQQGVNLLNQSKYLEALQLFQQSLAISREIGDRRGEGNSLGNIGGIYSILSDYPKALDFYEQSLAINREIGNRGGESVSLNNIGGVYNSQGNYPKALDFYEQSLAIRREVGDQLGEGNMLNNIGGIYDRQGDYATALDFYEQALTIRQEN